MSNRYFASDHHLWHLNILGYGQRPFHSLKEMHEVLITKHNELVRPNDHVSFLGDVTMLRGGRLNRDKFIHEIRSYHGHKRLYLGNHDHFPIKVYLDAGFEKIYGTWKDENRVLFSHIPIHPNSMGSAIANIHGHVHQNPSPEAVMYRDKNQDLIVKPYINVSVEAINYTPIHYDDLMKRIAEAKKP